MTMIQISQKHMQELQKHKLNLQPKAYKCM